MNEHKQVGQAGNQAGKSMAGCSLNQGGGVNSSRGRKGHSPPSIFCTDSRIHVLHRTIATCLSFIKLCHNLNSFSKERS